MPQRLPARGVQGPLSINDPAAQATLAQATRLEQGGDLLLAYDAVAQGLAADPSNLALRHRAVLLLARSGAGAQAQWEYLRLGLDAVHDHVDIVSLGGRLLKDLALAAGGDERRALAKAAAEKYAEAYALHGDYYPGINLATLALIAGDAPRSTAVARAILDGLAKSNAADDAYYRAATRAEACFLLGRLDEAEAALAAAIALDPGNHTAHASTLRQLDAICAALQIDRDWLDRHSPPPPVTYCGHMFGVLAGEADERLRAEIAKTLGRIKPGAAFGALAAGADILVAEAALALGAELHVVLPMDEKTFLARSVTPSGAAWETRYHACKARAATLRIASRENDFDDDAVFAFGSELAMGLAIRHGEALRSRAVQLAVWDGVPGEGVAGTAADVRRWAATKYRQEIVAFPPRTLAARTAAPAAPRKLKAMLFGDVRGFSRLAESEITPFVTGVKAPLAAALRRSGVKPDLVATWGDGLHIVCASVAEAADAALAMQAGFAGIDLAAAGLPAHLALRIGGHFGPVAEQRDPFMERPSFYGTHVTIAARIEPVAVPGSVYVSEPFAALLALEAPGRFATDYVGQTELPKGFGTMRLFSLRHADSRA